MCAIQSSHYLQQPAGAPAPEPADAASQSSYSYLFPVQADDPNASRFIGTDDGETLQRLKDFEAACRLPNGRAPLPVLTIRLPAAYTYFGQFLNHDISAPIGGLLQNPARSDPVGIIGTVDPAGLAKEWRADVAKILRHFRNEHADPMTLASLYGDGPKSRDQKVRALYEPDGKRLRKGATRAAPLAELKEQTETPEAVVHATDAPDILRENGVPLIADQRNDGNLILSQLHLAFLLLHNKAVTKLEAAGTPDGQIFDEARQLVTLHYHWLILNDFLPRLLSRSVLTRPLSLWQPREIPSGTVPMEFTTAAFRFGHSMVGRSYDFNANFGQDGLMSTDGATLQQLFDFTSKGRMGDTGAPIDKLPDHWVIEWDRLTRDLQPGAAPGGALGHAERLDLDFAPEMLNQAGDARVIEQGSILFRNLLRGFHRRIPFGQILAEACHVPRLSPEEIKSAMPQHESPLGGRFPDPATAAEKLGLLDETPAWLYFLCEAQLRENGERVGPTASQIIADTIVSLMQSSPNSLLRHKGGSWTPRNSLLKDDLGQPLDSLRRFLLLATDQAG
jgi:Animal haem peroxidase